MSAAGSARLRERYTAEPVPPCRVCGGPLAMQRSGEPAEWACAAMTGNIKSYAEDDPGWRHYKESGWTQWRAGDPEVIALLDRAATLEAMLATGLSPWRPGDPDSSLHCDQRPWRDEARRLLAGLAKGDGR